MVHGRTGSRPLDDPAYDDLFATAARLRQPIFIHPQIPSDQLRDAAYRGLDPLVDLGLATFGWDGDRPVLRRHRRPGGARQDRLRQRRGPVPAGLTRSRRIRLTRSRHIGLTPRVTSGR
jgi:hypothetical protein